MPTVREDFSQAFTTYRESRAIEEHPLSGAPAWGQLLVDPNALEHKIGRSQYIADLLEAPGKTILDFGSGGGFLANYLAAAGAARVVGVEINADWRRNASFMADEVFRVGDRVLFSPNLSGLTPESVDAVLLTNVVSHIYPCIELLLRLAHLLRPGGILFIEDNNNHANPLMRRRWRQLIQNWSRTHPADQRRRHFGGRPDGDLLAELTYGMTYAQMDHWVDEPRDRLEALHAQLRRRAPLNPDNEMYHENAFDPRHLQTIVENLGFAVCRVYPKYVFDFKSRLIVSASLRRFPRLGLRISPAYELLATKV